MRALILFFRSMGIALIVGLGVSYMYVDSVRGFVKGVVWYLGLQPAPDLTPIFTQSQEALLSLSTETPDIAFMSAVFAMAENLSRTAEQIIENQKAVSVEYTKLQVTKTDLEKKDSDKPETNGQSSNMVDLRIALGHLKERLGHGKTSASLNILVKDGSLRNQDVQKLDWKSKIPDIFCAQGFIRWSEPLLQGPPKFDEGTLKGILTSKLEASELPPEAKKNLKAVIDQSKIELILVNGFPTLHALFNTEVHFEIYVTPIGDRAVAWATKAEALDKILVAAETNQIPIVDLPNGSFLRLRLNATNILGQLPGSLEPTARASTADVKNITLQMSLNQNLSLNLIGDFDDNKKPDLVLQKLGILKSLSASTPLGQEALKYLKTSASGNRLSIEFKVPLEELDKKINAEAKLQNDALVENLRVLRSLTAYMNSYHLIKADLSNEMGYFVGSQLRSFSAKFTTAEMRPILVAYQVECPFAMSYDFHLSQAAVDPKKTSEQQMFYSILSNAQAAAKTLSQAVDNKRVQALLLSTPQYTRQIDLQFEPKATGLAPTCNLAFVPFVLSQPK